MSQRDPRRFITTLFVISLTPPIFAVDSWLVTDKHVVKPGGDAWIAFITGDVFPIGDGIVDPTRIDGLIDLHDGRRRPIDGLRVEDDAVALRQQFDNEGFHILGLSLKPRVIALDGTIFDQYLRDEGADDALRARQLQSNARTGVRERYTKYAKTIIEVGAAGQDNQDFLRPIGQRLEIVPLANPTRLQSGNEVAVKVLLDGHPWPNVPITASHEGTQTGEVAFRGRTNEQGVARWRLTQSGQWFARAHFIRPVNGLVNYEWESFWTTFSFGVKGKANVSGSMHLLRAIHGDINPWAVAGFLMGERALVELDMTFGTDRLLALHHCPQKLPYTAVLDGIQAATGATVGKLNLRMIPATASELRCEFFDMESGNRLIYQFTPAMLDQLLGAKDGDARALAIQMMTLPEADIFVATSKPDNPVTRDQATQPPSQPASDKSKEKESLSKTVKLQAQARGSQAQEINFTPLRINIPSQTMHAPTINTNVKISRTETRPDKDKDKDKDKDIDTVVTKSKRRPGPGEVFWRLAHQHDGAEQKSPPFPLQELSGPEILAKGR